MIKALWDGGMEALSETLSNDIMDFPIRAVKLGMAKDLV